MEFRVLSVILKSNGQEQLDIDSSNIKSAKYSPNTRTLTVEFNNRSVYEYYDIPRFIFLLFKRGINGSNGRAFWRFIRKVGYDYRKIG